MAVISFTLIDFVLLGGMRLDAAQGGQCGDYPYDEEPREAVPTCCPRNRVQKGPDTSENQDRRPDQHHLQPDYLLHFQRFGPLSSVR